MTISRLVIAALLATAGVAHADTVATQPPPTSAFVSNWTTGNGTDILGSGVLQGSLNLVGGVAYGTGSDANLTDVLYGKVAGTVGKVDGQTKLFFQRGIEASYLLASGHGILAATLGPGKSVVGSADGAVILEGVTKAPGMSGGGGMSSGGGGVGSGGSGGGSTKPSTPANNTGGTSGSGGQTGSTGGTTGTTLPAIVGNTPNQSGLVVPLLETPASDVPEPSSIALMLAGMVGAGALTRRRTRQ